MMPVGVDIYKWSLQDLESPVLTVLLGLCQVRWGSQDERESDEEERGPQKRDYLTKWVKAGWDSRQPSGLLTADIDTLAPTLAPPTCVCALICFVTCHNSAEQQ